MRTREQLTSTYMPFLFGLVVKCVSCEPMVWLKGKIAVTRFAKPAHFRLQIDQYSSFEKNFCQKSGVRKSGILESFLIIKSEAVPQLMLTNKALIFFFLF